MRTRRRTKDGSESRSGWLDWFTGLDFFPADDGIGLAILLIVGLIVAVAFMIFLGIPLLIFLVESLLIIPVLVVVGVVGRVLFGRPWTLEASTQGPPARTVLWNVVGWGASAAAANQMAGMIRTTGAVPERPLLENPRAHRRARR